MVSEAGVPLSFRCSSWQIGMKGEAGDGREVMEGEEMEGKRRDEHVTGVEGRVR